MNLKVKHIARLEGHRGAIYSINPFDQPHTFLSAAGDGWIVSWDLQEPENGQLLARVEGNIYSSLYLKEQHWAVAGDMYGGLHWLDLATKTNFKSSQLHQKGIFDIKLLGQNLLVAGGDGSLSRWNIERQQAEESLQLSHDHLRSVAYSEERGELAIAASDGFIYLLDAESWRPKKKWKAHENSVFTLAYDPKGRYLFSGGRDAYLRIWDIENDFEERPTEAAHLFTVNAIAFHPNASIMATASRDKSIKIWDAENLRLLKVIDAVRGGHINSVNDLWWSTYNNQLVSCSDDRSLRIWEFDMEG